MSFSSEMSCFGTPIESCALSTNCCRRIFELSNSNNLYLGSSINIPTILRAFGLMASTLGYKSSPKSWLGGRISSESSPLALANVTLVTPDSFIGVDWGLLDRSIISNSLIENFDEDVTGLVSGT